MGGRRARRADLLGCGGVWLGNELQPGATLRLSPRQAQVIELYAARPVGQGLADFLAALPIDRTTWWRWRQQPEFRREGDRIDAERRRAALEPLATAWPAAAEPL